MLVPDLVAVGASAGGPRALSEIFRALPANFPCPVIVVQHMTTGFVEGLVAWLAGEASMPLRVAADGDRLENGVGYFAPADRHAIVSRSRRLRLTDDPPRHACRPSIDVLLQSVAVVYGPHALGVLLTGMGVDGAEGLLAIRQAGGRTIVQDETSAVIFGIPRAAVKSGAAQMVLPLSLIAPTILRIAQRARVRDRE